VAIHIAGEILMPPAMVAPCEIDALYTRALSSKRCVQVCDMRMKGQRAALERS